LTESRMSQLATQLCFRLEEGSGKCYYRIGYEDNGTPKGLSAEDMKESINNLKLIADSVNARILTCEWLNTGDSDKVVAFLELGRKLRHILGTVVFLGESETGKTSLIGALTSGSKDDGRGSLRMTTSKLAHEVLNGGCTSAATTHVMEIDKDISVTLIDLPGNQRFRKTVFKTLLTRPVDLAIFTSSNMPDMETAVNHLGIQSVHINTMSDLAAKNETPNILSVSAVTREGIDQLKTLIFDRLHSRPHANKTLYEDKRAILSCDTGVWFKESVILGCRLISGPGLKTGDLLFLQSSRANFCESIAIKNIRDSNGEEVDFIDQINSVCTVAISLPNSMDSGSSTACSSSFSSNINFVPSKKLRKDLKPPLLLSSDIIDPLDQMKVIVNDISVSSLVEKDSYVMVYWRANKQVCKITEITEIYGVVLWTLQFTRRDEFVLKNELVIIENNHGKIFTAQTIID
jgi:signal recognition particle receptor subunit beta